MVLSFFYPLMSEICLGVNLYCPTFVGGRQDLSCLNPADMKNIILNYSNHETHEIFDFLF